MKKVFVIAEVGVNHNADISLAFQLIDEAVKAGADAVKFQAAVPELVATPSASKSQYQIQSTRSFENQLEMIRSLHFPLDAFVSLKAKCEELGIVFFASAFDLVSLDFLENLGQPIHKVPSGEITNLPFLERIGKFNKPILLSTGMSVIQEISDAVTVLEKSGAKRDNITILHCNTEYPSPFDDVNLKALINISNHFGISIGYSDHTEGITVPIAAVALGASVIEKHFTIDQSLPGPDQKASLNPQEFKNMVKAIRQTELALGSKEKFVTPSERINLIPVRRSLVASRPIKLGERFSEKNIVAKRPATGISPMLWHDVIGQKAKKDFEKDELIIL